MTLSQGSVSPCGPLDGIRVIEFSGLGPLTYAGMLLADLGADVVRIERPGALVTKDIDNADVTLRGRQRLELDMKDPRDFATVRDLVAIADVLIEAHRPGVLERLGLGPDDAHKVNPSLIYGRLTGWGQAGERANTAGHDINYIALSGALAAIGEADRPPVPPLALAGDFGGGAMFLVAGICAALYRRTVSGTGEVIDAAMMDGSASLMSGIYKRVHSGEWLDDRQSNLIDGAAPFYRAYECRDGQYVAVGCIERKFFDQMLQELDVARSDFGDRRNRADWPRQSALLQSVFLTKDRDEWDRQFRDTDCCVTPVLTMREVIDSTPDATRPRLHTVSGYAAPLPAPRFTSSPTPGSQASSWTSPSELLEAWR